MGAEQSTLPEVTSDVHRLKKHVPTKFEAWEETPNSGEAAWERLVKGNQNFVQGNLVSMLKHSSKNCDVHHRRVLAEAQYPYAVVVTCSDSRIAPEILFDTELGDIFVIRVAGNALSTLEVASIEYGILEAKAKLLLIVGHTGCGAITTALNSFYDHASERRLTPSIKQLVNLISPLAKAAHVQHPTDRALALTTTIELSVRHARRFILDHSESLKAKVERGEVKVVTAVYDMPTGVVSVLNEVVVEEDENHK